MNLNQEDVMNLRTAVISIVFAACSLLTAAPAQAGIPVYDGSVFAQQIQQVIAWGKQAQQMVDQITRLQQQFQQLQTMTNKLDAARALGSILNDPLIKSSLPPEMQNASQLLLNPSALTTNPAAISNILASFGITAPLGNSATSSSADAFGKAQAILTSSQQRQTQLQNLATRVDSAGDAKESLDLLNRNTLEVANINNQLVQTIASLDSARRAQEMRESAELQDFAAKLRSGAAAPIRNIP
ncbi:MAG: type IV secretion system protein [Burkholderiaceae bacterium]